MEILAETANGCLTELGYLPGMPQRLHEAEAKASQWQTENIKLYEDNTILTKSLEAMKNDLALVSEPEAKKVQKINELERKVAVLQSENSKLLQTVNLSLTNKPSGSAIAPHDPAVVLEEYHRLLASYQQALGEIQYLKQALAEAHANINTIGRYLLSSQYRSF